MSSYLFTVLDIDEIEYTKPTEESNYNSYAIYNDKDPKVNKKLCARIECKFVKQILGGYYPFPWGFCKPPARDRRDASAGAIGPQQRLGACTFGAFRRRELFLKFFSKK